MTDLFTNQELQPSTGGDRPLSPRTEGNAGAAPVTVRFPEHVKLASETWRNPPPCCMCGEILTPYGFREVSGHIGTRRYFGACIMHRVEVDEIVKRAQR